MKLGAVLLAQWKYLTWNMIWDAFSRQKCGGNCMDKPFVYFGDCVLHFYVQSSLRMPKLLFSLSVNAALLSSGFSETVDGHIRSCWCCFETQHAYHFSSVVLVKCWFLPHVLRNAGKLQRIHQSWALMNKPESAWSGFLEDEKKTERELKRVKKAKGKPFPPLYKTNI